jgi:hypothetical protein
VTHDDDGVNDDKMHFVFKNSIICRRLFLQAENVKKQSSTKKNHANESKTVSLARRCCLPLPVTVLFQVLDMLTSPHKPNIIPQTIIAPSSISVNPEE